MPEDFENSPYFSKYDSKEGLEPIDIKSLSPAMQSRIAQLGVNRKQANVQEIARMVIAERDGLAAEKGITPEEAEKLLGEK